MQHAPSGFRFTPTRRELIRWYVDPWVADPSKTPAGEIQGIVCVADVYSADPTTLTSRHRRFGHDDGNWYFLCVARWKGSGGAGAPISRAVRGGGTWHGYGRRIPVPGAGRRQTFEYLNASGRKTPWLMEEFATVLPAATDGAGVRVLCRVHQTTRPVADDDEESVETSKKVRSSKRRRQERDFAADAMDEPEMPLEILAKDEPEPLEMLPKDLPQPLEIFTMNGPQPLEMLTKNLPLPLEMLSKNLPLPLEMLTKNLPLPLEMLTKNLPVLTKNLREPLEMLTKNLPLPSEIHNMYGPEPLENLTKEDEPEPLDSEAPTTITAFDQDYCAAHTSANKEATSNTEMEMPTDAECYYPELFEQRAPPTMEDAMKPLSPPPVQEFEQGQGAPTATKDATKPSPVQKFGEAAWAWRGHGRRCLVRPLQVAWRLPSF